MALPGVYTTVKDRFYALSRTNIPIGPKIVVLGKRSTADGTGDVVDLDPYNLQDEKNVVTAFGYGSDIHRAFLELLSAGATRVTVVALPSDTEFDYATGTISSANFDAAYDDDETLFEVAMAAVESAEPDIFIPYGRGSSPGEWTDPATPDFNADYPYDDDYSTYFGFYADNSSTVEYSFAKKIIDRVAEINENTHPCLAVMGIKPYIGTTESMTPGQVSSHMALTNLVDKEDITESGFFLAVVQGEVKPVGYPTAFGYANAACTFAGSLAELDSWSSPTGKPLYNIDQIRYKLTNTLKESVSALGVIPVSLNLRRQPVWVDAMTFSKEGSDYARVTTIRIVNDATNMVRQTAAKFIGEVASTENRNSLETAITSGLRGMQQVGALLASDFIVTYDEANNKAIIDLVLTVAFEIRTIEVRVSVLL